MVEFKSYLSSSARTARPRRGEVRQRLLVAAEEVLISHGYGAASVDTITQSAGLSRGALYSNFSDKEDLYLSLLDELERRQVEELAELYDHQQDLDQFLKLAAGRPRSTRHDAKAHLIVQTELWLVGTRNESVRLRLAAIQRHTLDAIARRFDGPSLGLTPDELAAVVFTLGDGLMMLRSTDPQAIRPGLLFDVLGTLAALAGLTPREPSSAPPSSS